MNKPRQKLLAGPALAQDEHGGRQFGHFLDQVDDVARRLAWTDNEFPFGLVGDLCRQGQHLSVQILSFTRVSHE